VSWWKDEATVLNQGCHFFFSIRRLAGVALVLLSGAACSSGPVDPSDAIAGTWSLSTINGQTLPFVWQSQDENNSVSFASGTLTLRADKTYTDHTDFSVKVDGASQTQPLESSGTWTLVDNTLTLTPAEAPPYSMTWDGSDRLSQNFDQLMLLYHKESP
jgi:hypothetical protein